MKEVYKSELGLRPRRTKPSWKVLVVAGVGFVMVAAAFMHKLTWLPLGAYALDPAMGVPEVHENRDYTPKKLKDYEAHEIRDARGQQAFYYAVEPAPVAEERGGVYGTWDEIKPDVLLTMSPAGFVVGSETTVIDRYGPEAVAAVYARQGGVAALTAAPSPRDTYIALARRFSAQEIILFFAVKEHSSLGLESRSDDAMAGILREECSRFELENCPLQTTSDLDAAYEAMFPQAVNWRDIQSPEAVSSIAPSMQEMEAYLGRFRAQYAVSVTMDAMRRGKRVLVVGTQEQLGVQASLLSQEVGGQRSFQVQPRR